MSDRELTTSYVMNELPEDERRAFELRLDHDDALRRDVNELRRMLDDLKALPKPKLSQDLSVAILDEIHQDKVILLSRVLKVAALFICLLGMGMFAGKLLNEKASTVNLAAKKTAIHNGATWLAQAQNVSGAWNAEDWGGQKRYTVGITGLALVSLLNADANPMNGLFTENIRQAISFLQSEQKPEGNIGEVYRSGLYNHAIATLALLEVYRLHPNPALKPTLDRAIDFTLNRQNGNAGWEYVVQESPSTDSGVSFWPLLVLEQAEHLGWRHVAQARERGYGELKQLISNQGGLQQAITAMSVWCFSRVQKEGDADLEKSYYANCESIIRGHDRSLDFYEGYFLANGLAAIHERQAEPLIRKLQANILNQQELSGPDSGSWNVKDHWSSVGGRIYTTTMATLTLMVNGSEGISDLRKI